LGGARAPRHGAARIWRLARGGLTTAERAEQMERIQYRTDRVRAEKVQGVQQRREQVPASTSASASSTSTEQ
jgi:hypothetical protein